MLNKKLLILIIVIASFFIGWQGNRITDDLQGVRISLTKPIKGNFLYFDGERWTPKSLLLSDLSGPYIFTGPVETKGSLTAPKYILSGAGEAQQISSPSGVADIIGKGIPSSPCITGSRYRRIDGAAGATFYGCENSAWVAK